MRQVQSAFCSLLTAHVMLQWLVLFAEELLLRKVKKVLMRDTDLQTGCQDGRCQQTLWFLLSCFWRPFMDVIAAQEGKETS